MREIVAFFSKEISPGEALTATTAEAAATTAELEEEEDDPAEDVADVWRWNLGEGSGESGTTLLLYVPLNCRRRLLVWKGEK